jgi:HSP20 family protein
VALVHRGRYLVDWPSVVWRDPWRRWLDFEGGDGWLRTEEYEEGDTLVVRAELPGVDPDKDVEVTVADGVVRIHAHREQEAEQKGKHGYRSEFRYGEFVREVLLPEGSVAEEVKASYSNGILEVRIPHHEKSKVEAIKVQVRQV